MWRVWRVWRVCEARRSAIALVREGQSGYGGEPRGVRDQVRREHGRHGRFLRGKWSVVDRGGRRGEAVSSPNRAYSGRRSRDRDSASASEVRAGPPRWSGVNVVARVSARFSAASRPPCFPPMLLYFAGARSRGGSRYVRTADLALDFASDLPRGWKPLVGALALGAWTVTENLLRGVDSQEARE